MTEIKAIFKEGTNEISIQPETKSIAELKEIIKDWSESTGEEVPKGLWKMKKEELVEKVYEIYSDLTKEVEEKDVEGEYTITEENNEKEVKQEETRERTNRVGGKKQVKMNENGKITIFEKADDAHQWLRANYGLGYNHIKQSTLGHQTKKLQALNITFEFVNQQENVEEKEEAKEEAK